MSLPGSPCPGVYWNGKANAFVSAVGIWDRTQKTNMRPESIRQIRISVAKILEVVTIDC